MAILTTSLLHVERLAADTLAWYELGLEARGAVEEHRHAALGRERLREALQEALQQG